MCLLPVGCDAGLGKQRHVEFCHPAHALTDDLAQPLGLFRGHFEDQFVMYLHDHAGRLPGFVQPRIHVDHGFLDQIGGRALKRRVDGRAFRALAARAVARIDFRQIKPTPIERFDIALGLGKLAGFVHVATHAGEAFEEVRLIRKENASGKSSVRHTDFERYSNRIAAITGKKPDKPAVARAKLYAALQPERSEMFFCNKVALVEGIEDRAYIAAALMLDDKWDGVRRAGLHIVPADRKSGILQMLVIGQELDIPTFVVFDADGDVTHEQHRADHERDNTHLMKALGIDAPPFPEAALWGDSYAIWPTQIGAQVKGEIGDKSWTDLTNKARQVFDPGAGGLAKNPLFIAETLRLAWEEGNKPPSLTQLSERLAGFASA